MLPTSPHVSYESWNAMDPTLQLFVPPGSPHPSKQSKSKGKGAGNVFLHVILLWLKLWLLLIIPSSFSVLLFKFPQRLQCCTVYVVTKFDNFISLGSRDTPTQPTFPLPREQVMLVTSSTRSAKPSSAAPTCGLLCLQGRTVPFFVHLRWVLLCMLMGHCFR